MILFLLLYTESNNKCCWCILKDNAKLLIVILRESFSEINISIFGFFYSRSVHFPYFYEPQKDCPFNNSETY